MVAHRVVDDADRLRGFDLLRELFGIGVGIVAVARGLESARLEHGSIQARLAVVSAFHALPAARRFRPLVVDNQQLALTQPEDQVRLTIDIDAAPTALQPLLAA